MIFVEEMNPYRVDLLVCVGATVKDIRQYAKKRKFKKDLVTFIDEHPDTFELEQSIGRALWVPEEKFAGIMLKPFVDAWEYWECLIHELHHIVEFISTDRSFEKENEAKAYLIEFLFHTIRRK